MFIKSGAIISEFFNIAKAQKNLGPQKMFSKSGCLVYPLTLFRASTVVNFLALSNLEIIYGMKTQKEKNNQNH